MSIAAVSYLQYWGLVLKARQPDADRLSTIALNQIDAETLKREGWKERANCRFSRKANPSDPGQTLVMYPKKAPIGGYRVRDDPLPGFWIFEQVELCLNSFKTSAPREWATNRYVHGVMDFTSHHRRLSKAVQTRLTQMLRSGDPEAMKELDEWLKTERRQATLESHRQRQRRYEESKRKPLIREAG
jgi:hypothetical protein